MAIVATFCGFLLVLATLLDAFEVVLLPRPARQKWRVNRFFFRWSWAGWAWAAQYIPAGRRREDFIGVFGPLSMVSLFSAWAIFLIAGFGLLHWAVQQFSDGPALVSFSEAMVVSGDAFFTLGYGDVVPHHPGGRFLVIVEAGTGFGFIALTIAYLPVLYQHFSRRDFQLIDLSARSGTPPSAECLLQWHAAAGGLERLNQWLRDWEIWASDLIESHSAYPMLAFHRSQHHGHSWLAALAVVLEVCSLTISGAKDGGPPQAAATFAAARRVLDVVAGSLEVKPLAGRSAQDSLQQTSIATTALQLLMPEWTQDAQAASSLLQLKRAYQPLLRGLSAYLLLPVPTSTAIRESASLPYSRTEVINRLTRLERSED